jgi:metal transporter CNNM
MEVIIFVLTVVGLIGISAVCSGLNLALMSLDPNDLKRKAATGDKRAAKILPYRKNSHLALSSILIGNVAVISTTSLVLESKISGLIAGLLSTLLIVIFGEIIPQAFLVHHALSGTYKLLPLLKVIMFITYPLAKPLQLILDKVLKERDADLHSRGELGLIIGEHFGRDESELDEGEVEIIRGALKLSEKRVKDIMTPMNGVYSLRIDDTIDAEKIDEIKAENWSRIPVFSKDMTQCFGILLMKDLVDIDFDETPVPVSQLKLHRTKQVGSMTALDTMMHKFIAGHTHLIPVERDGKLIGVVSIEDLLEEIIGQEIEDESD